MRKQYILYTVVCLLYLTFIFIGLIQNIYQIIFYVSSILIYMVLIFVLVQSFFSQYISYYKRLQNTRTHKTARINLSIILFFSLCIYGCSKGDVKIYKNKSFKDVCSIAKKNNSYFCIVLTDSSQELSKEYNFNLQKYYKHLTNKAIYNLIDIKSSTNEWYIKWLCPISTPLTCIFSPNGRLIDLIPGVAKETFLYTESTLENMKMSDYHWPNRFNIKKSKIISLLDSVLLHKEYLNQGIYLDSELSNLINSLSYPYSEYLKLVGELIQNDTIQAKISAKAMLKFETPFCLDLYKNELIKAKKIIDPNFDITKEPNIRVNKTTISLSNCVIEKSTPINITIYNDGNKPLIISNIHTSCSCLKQINTNDKYFIKNNDSIIVNFDFTASHEGEISRDIFITSNAINTPILHINILAYTKSSNN